MINTAGADVVENGKIFGPQRVGSGRVNAKSAVDNQVPAYVQDDPGGVSASFGVVKAAGPVNLSKTIKMANKGTAAAEYAVAYEDVTPSPGVRSGR
ncbi:hypothetical protein CFN78_20640 [Amycolatopsis antarctica]|uniref:Uncharacterized protein n=1 Tax=Amycolatopsis antarctica TaxID=1854586 RepID=A0A263CYH8_9PSEU|nr:hypothetical protein CFN78_20640 [Amycolatopsis antarctica]